MEEIMKEPNTLLAGWLQTIRPWQAVFAQQRTFVRAARQALGSLLVLGRATVSRILWTSGREQKSWSGEYFLHARAVWDAQALFTPLLEQALALCPANSWGSPWMIPACARPAAQSRKPRGIATRCLPPSTPISC